MGLMSGGPNGRRFRVSTELPSGFRDLYLEQVREHAFVEDVDACDGEPRLGWVDLFDPAVTTFELNNLLYDQVIALSLRADTKKIQGSFFQIARAHRIAKICEQRGVERLSKSDAEQVTEELETELLKRALPNVATTEVCWDLSRGVVWVFSTSEGPLEHVRQLFKETFGVALVPERTLDWLTDRLDRSEVDERIRTWLGGVAGGDDPLEGKGFALGSDFLTWLWLQSETTDGVFRVLENPERRTSVDASDDDEVELTERLRHADLTVWIDDRLMLRELEKEQPETTLVTGQAPSSAQEARRGLALGKRPVDVRIGLQLNDLECAIGLSATDDGPRISSPKIPFAVKTGRDERLFERIALLDLLHTTVGHLFRQFFLDRTSPSWAEKIEPFLADAEMAAK